MCHERTHAPQQNWGGSTPKADMMPRAAWAADEPSKRVQLLLLAGVVGRVHVLNAKWSFATNLNDCLHFGERIVVDIRRKFDEAPRLKLIGSLLIQLVAGSEVKLTGDNRYTFGMRMFVGWNLYPAGIFRRTMNGPDFPASPDKPAS
jgi:hypothetical protein